MATRPSIIHLITELGYSSERDLQEVQARQVIYGGDQESNLLELGLVSEDQLLIALAQQTGLPRAPTGRLPFEIEPTRKLVQKGAAIAMGQSAEGNWIAYIDRVPDSSEYAAVREQYGDDCRFLVTTALRLAESIAMAQGQKLEARAAALLTRLGNHETQRPSLPVPKIVDDPSQEHGERVTPLTQAAWTQLPEVEDFEEATTAETTPAPIVEQVPTIALRPMSAKTSAFEEHAPSSRGETAPPPLGYEDITASADVQRSVAVSGHPVRHVYNRADAEQDLRGAKNRDRVIDILLHFAAAHFEYTAVFGILSKEARGLKATGPGANTEELRALHIPLDLPSVLRQVLSDSTAQVSRLRASGLEGGITRDLKRSSGTDVFLLPICVANRPVLLLWGDNGRHRISIEEFRELTEFGDFVSKSLEHVLIERKRASRVAQPPDLTIPPPAASTTIHSKAAVHSKAALLLGGSTHSAPLESVPPSSTPVSPRPPRRQTQRNSAAPAPGSPPENLPGSPPAVEQDHEGEGEGEANLAQGGHEVAEAKKRTLTRPGQGPERTDSDPPSGFPIAPPRTLRGFPEPRTPSLLPQENVEPDASVIRIHTPKDDEAVRPREPLLSRRIVPLSAPPPEHKKTGAVSEAPPPPPWSQPAKVETSPPAPLSTPSFAMEPKRRSSTMMSRAPIPEPDADGWGSPSEAVVRRVDPIESQRAPNRQSYSDLVRELLAGNTKVIPRLVDGGETAVGALIAQFPGPVCAPARPTTKASECGPILEALAALGSKATPFLTVRTADEDPEVRRWATFLLGEMPGKDSAKAIASRLLDDSVEVRRAALASARRARGDVLTRRTLRAHIEQICRDPNVPIESRCSAVEALADVREHEAIPTLLVLLEGDDRALSRATRWALSVLTRQDFGSDIVAWRAFWQEHRDEDRVEWLIASLDHEQRDIRRAAGEELKAMSNGEVEYDEDQPSSARRLAQAQFREWWKETGKPSVH